MRKIEVLAFLIVASLIVDLAGCKAGGGSDAVGGEGGSGNSGSTSSFSNVYSIGFNGTSQYLSAGSVGISAYPFSVSAWIKTTSASAGTIMGLFNAAATNQMFRVSMNAGGTVSMVAQNTVARTNTSVAAVNNGNWHQIVAVYASATSRALYIDGAADSTGTTNVTFTTLASTLAVGVTDTSTPSTFFPGQIDEPTLWTVALSASDVATLYNAGASRDLTGSAGLAAWWRLGDAAGDDLAGTGVLIDQVGALNLGATAFSGVSPASHHF